MNFSKLAPCDNCPFRVGTSIILNRQRAKEIADMMLSSYGGTFPCHKTTEFDEDGEHVSNANEVHCAGALIFAEKHGNATQMMRIAGRIGIYNPDALMGDTNPAIAQVFDSKRQFVKWMTRK